MADVERATIKKHRWIAQNSKKETIKKKKILNMKFENPDRPLNIKFSVL